MAAGPLRVYVHMFIHLLNLLTSLCMDCLRTIAIPGPFVDDPGLVESNTTPSHTLRSPKYGPNKAELRVIRSSFGPFLSGRGTPGGSIGLYDQL